MKPIILKRQVKLKNLRYEIDGVDTWKPLLNVLSAIVIGALLALAVFIFGLAFISYLIS